MEMVHELVSLFIFVSEADNKIQCNQLEIECSTYVPVAKCSHSKISRWGFFGPVFSRESCLV